MYIGIDIPSNININILRYCSNLPNLCFSLYQHRYMYFLQGQHLLKCQSNVYENRRSGVMAPANPKNKINDKDQQSNADENGDGMRCYITNDDINSPFPFVIYKLFTFQLLSGFLQIYHCSFNI